MSTSHSSENHEGGHDGHILPFSVYRNSFLILLVLTVITVAAAQVDFGALNFVMAMLIATVKATLVGLYFMHLRYETPVIWACVVVPIILLGVLLLGLFIDNPLRAIVEPHKVVAATPVK